MFFSDFLFFSEVLNLNKSLRIVFIFLRILGDFEWQNSLQNYNKNENKKKQRKKIRPKFSHANVNKTNKNS